MPSSRESQARITRANAFLQFAGTLSAALAAAPLLGVSEEVAQIARTRDGLIARATKEVAAADRTETRAAKVRATTTPNAAREDTTASVSFTETAAV